MPSVVASVDFKGQWHTRPGAVPEQSWLKHERRRARGAVVYPRHVRQASQWHPAESGPLASASGRCRGGAACVNEGGQWHPGRVSLQWQIGDAVGEFNCTTARQYKLEIIHQSPNAGTELMRVNDAAKRRPLLLPPRG